MVKKGMYSPENWPSEEILKPMRDRLSDPNYDGTFLIGSDSSPVDKAKYALCQIMVNHLRATKLSQGEFALKLGAGDDETADVIKHKIYKFTIDRLIELAEKVAPGLKINIRVE